MLNSETKTPLDVAVKNIDNQEVTLKDELGKYIVLYFYPQDNTPGCTTQACSFRDYNLEIQKLGAKIIGVSSDSIESHKKFKIDFNLNFELWSDANLDLIKAFQVLEFFANNAKISRSTFLINPQGVIIKVWKNVDPSENPKEVYEYLKNLSE